MDSTPPFFLPPVIYNPLGYGFEYVRVAIADVNGDGKPDLLVANRFACSGCATGSVAVLLGNGDGTFQPAVTTTQSGSETESVVVADVNGDGKPDIVLGNGDSGPSVAVLLGMVTERSNRGWATRRWLAARTRSRWPTSTATENWT